MKKTITILFITLLMICSSYQGLCPVYASSDEWQNSDLSMQAQAFLAYCKSNNLVIDGSVADALTTFTTDTYYKLCNTLGINVTEMESDIKYAVDQNGGLRFLFNTNGVNAMNRVFSLFLQNNDLAVGESADKTVIDNQPFYNNSFCFVTDSTPTVTSNGGGISRVKYLSIGSYYKYDCTDILSMYNGGSTSFTVPFNNTDFTFPINHYYASNGAQERVYPYDRDRCWYTINGNPYYSDSRYGRPAIVYSTRTNKLYLAVIYSSSLSVVDKSTSYSTTYLMVADSNEQPTNVTINIVSTTINNNTYEGDTIINNDGTTDDPLDPPLDDPWNPSTPVIPPYSPGDNTVIDIPDIDIPDLPSLDFSLGDLREKFPFSIPFDIIALLSVLDGEPRAPVIDAHIPIGSLYDWHFQADFSAYDDTAALIRSIEFIGFCIGLIVITIRLVKG